MGKHLVTNFISPDYRESVQRVFDDALQGSESANFEFPLFTKGGQRLEVLLNATTRRDAAGNIVGVIGVGQDITESKQAAEKQENVAKELRQFVETANAPIFGIDVDGNVNEWNGKAESIVGYTKDETIGRHLVQNFISPDYRESVQRVLDDALRGREAQNFEFPLYTKEGERLEVLLNATTRRDVSGKIYGVIGVGQDITERKKAEVELASVAKELRQFIETANAPIFGVDCNGRVNEWNNKMTELLGYTKEEASGEAFAEIVRSEEDRVTVKSIFASALRGEATPTFEIPFYTKEQRDASDFSSPVYILFNANPRHDVSNQVVGVLSVGQDVTHFKRVLMAEVALSKAKAANDAKSQFLANMSHEMRTPLNGIIGMNELLSDSLAEADQRELSRQIRTSANGLLTLISDILDLTRVEAGQLELEASTFSLTDTVEEAVDSLAHLAVMKGVEVLFTVDKEAPQVVKGDGERLKQVMLNLLSNALKFTSSGEIELTVATLTEDEKGWLMQISVRDTGIGINKSALSRLFTRFSQVDSSTTRRYGGTGLGLAISKQLVELMGGEISVESEPGKGSTFSLTARLARAAPQTKELLASPTNDATSDVAVVMVAQNAAMRQWLRRATAGAPRAQVVASLQSSEFHVSRLELAARSASDGAKVMALISVLNVKELEEAARVYTKMSSAVARWVILAPIMLRAQALKLGEERWTVLTKPAREAQVVACISALSRDTTYEAPVRGDMPNTLDALANIDRGADEAEEGEHGAQWAKLRVLIVEDDQVSRNLAARMLRQAGYESDLAENGATALDMLFTPAVQNGDWNQVLAEGGIGGRYHCVLLDLNMPIMDGAAVARKLRQEENNLSLFLREKGVAATRRMPLLGITGGTPEDIETCRSAGMDRFVKKPISSQTLIAAVRSCDLHTPGDEIAGRTSTVSVTGTAKVAAATGDGDRKVAKKHDAAVGTSHDGQDGIAGRVMTASPIDPSILASVDSIREKLGPGSSLHAMIVMSDANAAERIKGWLLACTCTVATCGGAEACASYIDDPARPIVDIAIFDARDPELVQAARSLCERIVPERLVVAGLGARADQVPRQGQMQGQMSSLEAETGGNGDGGNASGSCRANSAALRQPQPQLDVDSETAAGVDGQEGAPASFTHGLPIPDDMSVGDLLPLLNVAVGVFEARRRPLALVAEDDLVSQKVIKGMLRVMSWKSVVVDNGQKAVEMLKKHNHFSVVILDCNMPVMTGWEAARMVRRAEGNTPCPIPILACTANAMAGDSEECARAGMNIYIPKPIHRSALEWALRMATQHIELRKELTARGGSEERARQQTLRQGSDAKLFGFPSATPLSARAGGTGSVPIAPEQQVAPKAKSKANANFAQVSASADPRTVPAGARDGKHPPPPSEEPPSKRTRRQTRRPQ